MSETPSAPDEPAEEQPRVHPEDPAEGPDDDERETRDVPRVHPDDPAEG
jgi:hypothetical protein